MALRDLRRRITTAPRSTCIALCLGLMFALRAEPAPAEPIHDFIRFRDQGNWAAAVEVARREIAAPSSRDRGYPIDMRTLGISALGNYANQLGGVDPRFDAEAQQYYREGLALARDDQKRAAQLHNVMGTYYSNTSRNGLGLTYYDYDLQHWLKAKDTYQIIRAYDALASAYNDMGERDVGFDLRSQALALAKDYFVLGRQPSEANLWLQYSAILDKHADSLAGAGERRQLEATFNLREAITLRYLAPKASTYDRYAKLFAIDGDIARARQLAAQAQEVWKGEASKYAQQARRMQADFACTAATIEFAARDYPRAATLAEECGVLLSAAGVPEDLNTRRERGRMFEAAGMNARALELLEASIADLERVRASYSVAERAAFFNTPAVRRAYWGSIRIRAKESEQAGNPPDRFFTAFSAVERIRARQFGDLADPNGSITIESGSLASFASRLPASEAVIAFVVMDDRVLVLAFDRANRTIATVNVGQAELNQRAERIWLQLSRSDSDVAQLEGEFLELSRLLLAPVTKFVQGRTNLVFASDGALSVLPLGLLSADAGNYRPLVQQSAVKLIPSLRMLMRPRRAAASTNGFIGLGDPAYPARISVAGLNEERVRALARRSGGPIFPPLPETRTEVEAIARLFGGQQTVKLFGREAGKSALGRQDLAAFGYVHFATHGVLGGEIPGIGEPALVLAEEQGGDPYLRATEAAALKLNAALTVLSACNTGSGRIMTGEGVLGMSRSFLLAGSRSVLMSLWPVNSKVTEELMVRFYTHERAGKPAAEALKNAMLDIRRQHRHPFYWAPFNLFQG